MIVSMSKYGSTQLGKIQSFFPRTLTIKSYSILFSVLPVSALSVGESNIHRFRGFSRFTTLLLQFFNQCLSFHQPVGKKCPLNSVLANPKRLHTNESALSTDWVHGRIISKVSVGLILLGQHVYVLIDFRVLCGWAPPTVNEQNKCER